MANSSDSSVLTKLKKAYNAAMKSYKKSVAMVEGVHKAYSTHLTKSKKGTSSYSKSKSKKGLPDIVRLGSLSVGDCFQLKPGGARYKVKTDYEESKELRCQSLRTGEYYDLPYSKMVMPC